ncbi:UdgX family uracil-DNA binding protein [Henriciella litoralis]|uniref:UdgX family uracil-DNA binding protein n=1 Tax=Henriciella litoralis TaxID=568102 RepID=UPI0009FE24C9|nr:UdgX family uracil-DNA binding protein [Henriciella litoralis]
MYRASLASPVDFEGWRTQARRFASLRIPPADIIWQVGEEKADLFAEDSPALPSRAAEARVVKVPKAFMQMAERAICHRDPQRFAWLYQLLIDLQANASALSDPLNEAAGWLKAADAQIRRDAHKMRAFVRFRKVAERDGRDVFMSWFEPDHRIVRHVAPFFVQRFTGMDWTILTPDACASWDGKSLTFAPGADRSQLPGEDAIEDQWKTYYASIFNPARLKVGAMMSEMPAKYWKNLPEAELIPGLIRQAGEREGKLLAEPSTPSNIRTSRMGNFFADAPEEDLSTLEGAREAASQCQRCALHACASQTVFGEGPSDARLMIIGEQPGDMEDIAGKPFVGPAGQLLDKAFEAAGLDRRKAYVTNAVKHFKFTPRGKRRMHQKPNAGEIDTCRFWLDLERSLVKPDIIVTLGASALRGVFGKAAALKDHRGAFSDLGTGARLIATIHPSYLLRLPDRARAAAEYEKFVTDLARARSLLDVAQHSVARLRAERSK